jgi:hypothetical protein
MEAKFDRGQLLEWLAAYSAAMEVMAVSVLAGSRRVASCPALADFIDEYRRVVPGGRAPVAQLAVAHRWFVLALRDLRDGRRDVEGLVRDVERARAEHSAIVLAALAELRTVRTLNH